MKTSKKALATVKGATLFLAAVAWILLAGPLAAAEHQEKISRQFEAQEGMSVELENLAGEIRVTGTSGNTIEIEATITGRGNNDAAAKELAAKLDVEFEQGRRGLRIRANYPVDEYTRYHYPGSSESGGSWFGGLNNKLEYQGRRVTVSSKPKGGAVTLYADFEVKLPRGLHTTIENAMGHLEAEGVVGTLEFDTGSGNVRAESCEGKIVADTGSGDVRLIRITGDVEADTGSGDVQLEDIEGGVIEADTGSGDVELRNVRGEIEIDTGSGDVEGSDLRAVGHLKADTGSGSVRLSGDLSGVDMITIDTGSGSVTLEASQFPPMDLTVSTGSGGIDVELPGVEVISQEKDYLKARVHGGGAKVVIDTGSGEVRLRHSQ